jgi:hypothetical protein
MKAERERPDGKSFLSWFLGLGTVIMLVSACSAYGKMGYPRSRPRRPLLS